MRILLAEDEEALSRAYATALSYQGHEVEQAFDGEQAVEKAARNPYDVMIFDVMMPKKTGIEALKEIRRSGNTTHVIMLTAMSEVDDRIHGLDAGADEYLAKPISLKELLARLRFMERRIETGYNDKQLQVGDVRLNVLEQEMTAGNSIRLAGKETRLMEYLMLNKGKRLSTEQIYHQVWSKEEEGEFDQGYVWIYISYLRQKLKAIKANIGIEGEENGDYLLTEIWEA